MAGLIFRIFLVPVMLLPDPVIGFVVRVPKYFTDGTIPRPGNLVVQDFGLSMMFAGASVTDAQVAILTANADVSIVPLDLDAKLTPAQVLGTRIRLEQLNLPGNWVDVTDSWRNVLRSTFGMCYYMQRYRGTYAVTNPGIQPPEIFSAGVTLATTFGALDPAVQAAMIAAADSFEPPLNRTGLLPTTTLRAIFMSMANQMDDYPYFFGPLTL